MRHSKLFAYVTLTAVFLFACAPLVFAEITTDKEDYSPGETVTISGNGYWAGETVSIEVIAPYGTESGIATANGNGEFIWQFTLPSDSSAVGSYSYTATGEDSGIVQSGTFTDGNVKIFPIPTTATFSATLTIYSNTTCGGSVVSGPTVETGISSPSGETTGVGNTQSVKIQAAAFSDQGGAFVGWTTSAPFVGTSTTAVTGDTICISGSFTGNRDYFANYGDPPGTLTVKKVLTNDNGGTAATTTFSFQINGASTTPFNTQGEVSFSLTPGTYSVTELAAAGYTTTYNNNKNGNADCTNLAVVTGSTTICTITNNDNAPSLTLIKVVVNDDGGTATTTDWTLTATGPTGFSGAGPIVSNGASFDAGTYTLSESGPSGYSASAWSCVGGNQTDDDTVEIALSESVTCTITNDDQAATLTLLKDVVNDNGGTAIDTDWTLSASGPTPISGSEGDASITNAAVNAGSYDLSESGPAGYTASNWVCQGGTQNDADTVTLALGDDVTCTITNDDNAPSLTLIKVVVNDDGGTATTTDWTLTATGPTGFGGFGPIVTNADISAGTYDLSENGPSGYTASSWVCQGGNQTDGDTVEIGLGESVTCTITNNDIAAVPPAPACDPGSGTATISIFICNSGTINSTTTADSFTGGNVAGGSTGGNGGNGGSVVAGSGNENNGGASGGNGGNGGNGGAGGLIVTGTAFARARSVNSLNSTDVSIGTPCNCAPVNSNTIKVVVDNSSPSNVITNNTHTRGRTGENVSLGSLGGSGGTGGGVTAGPGDENNGGASAGTGGSGGSSARGGIVSTGSATSDAEATNQANRTSVRVGH